MRRKARASSSPAATTRCPTLEAKYQAKGFGYAGADLYQGGYLTGQAMVAAGLKAGDKALVYDIWHQEGRSRSSQGVYDALTKAGLQVEKLDVSDGGRQDASLAIPILTAYLAGPPRSQGHRHPARQHHRRPAEGAAGGGQEAR